MRRISKIAAAAVAVGVLLTGGAGTAAAHERPVCIGVMMVQLC